MLITTDIGNLSEEQIKYLVKNKVLLYKDGNFYISGIYIDSSEFKRKVPMYSLFLHCLEWAIEVSNTRLKGLFDQLQYLIDNDVDIITRGKILVVESISKQRNGGRKKQEFNFD